MILDVTCPYCGFKQRRELGTDSVQLFICDSEEGGCDKTSVVRIEIQAKAISLKIAELTGTTVPYKGLEEGEEAP